MLRDIRIPARFTSTEARYLTLLIRALTRYGLERLTPDEENARWAGADWPADAETMVGVPRLEQMVEYVTTVVDEGIPGDLAECGSWRGGTCILMAATLDVLDDTDRTVWCCDSFSGLPKPDPTYPVDNGDVHHTFPELAVPLKTVQANVARYGMAHRIDYVQGWFADSLPGPIGPLAILRCDGDMYSSTTQTLTALYPHLSPGGYCVIDDYAGTDTRGADRAVHDYRTAHTVTEPIRQGDQRAAAWRHDA